VFIVKVLRFIKFLLVLSKASVCRVFDYNVAMKIFIDLFYKKLILTSGLFDETWYLSKYSGAGKGPSDALSHFLDHGKKGFDPGPEFSSTFYLSTYPDVANEGVNPLVHYVRYGKKEGRYYSEAHRYQESVRLIASSALFDGDWYIERYPEVKKSELSPVLHYLKYSNKGFDPGPNFSSEFYISTYPDVLESRLNPLVHYLRYGKKEGRYYSESHRCQESVRLIASSALFDSDWYIERYPEVKKSELSPILHYLKYSNKGFDPGPNFSSEFYLSTYPDVLESRLNPLVHYLRFGCKEGRLISSRHMHAPVKPSVRFVSMIAVPRKLAYMTYNLYSQKMNAAQMQKNIAAINQLAQWRTEELDWQLNVSQAEVGQLPEIDVSVVTYKNSKWLEVFFSSLIAQSYPLDKINLYFTDNSSLDETVSNIEQYIVLYGDKFASVHVQVEPNNGFGCGHDAAIRKGKSEFILVTNVDIEFTVDAIERVVQQAACDPKTVASWELRQQPFEHPKYYDPVTLDTAWSSHACVLMRREHYDAVGGYEKRIFMYGEDVELSYRFRRAGYRLKYIPSAVVNHYTYEHENQIKPLQYFGSTLANAYIRLRYGNALDILTIFALYTAILVKGGPLSGARKGLLNNLGKIIANIPYFLLSRKRASTNALFPFHLWDYEMIRDGAFYSPTECNIDSQPLVSIVTRTYAGREPWLQEAIMSVFQQTYSNIELIVVEDGGDSHQALIEKIGPLFKGGRSLCYSAQPKNGRSFNGNAGLSLANGQLMMFLDDDDLLFPDHVEVLVNALLSREDCNAAYSLAWEVQTRNIDGDVSFYYEESHKTPEVLYQDFNRDLIKKHNYFPIQSVLFKRELFECYGGFDVEMDQLEDWDLWMRYSSESVFVYVPKTTSLYRTPFEIVERARRNQLLHESYGAAVEKQKAFLSSLPLLHQ